MDQISKSQRKRLGRRKDDRKEERKEDKSGKEKSSK